jgi:hypothetical protein
MWRETVRGIGNATGYIRANRRIFVIVAVSVLFLNIVLPPLVLSVIRKPYDHFSFNPWLRNLPAWLTSDEATWGRKFEFLYNAALYWFIASSPYDAPEWGYSATVRDVLRWVLLSLSFGTYFALWSARRGQMLSRAPAAAGRSGGRAGLAGAFLSSLGFSTLPCSVVGCGAPVLPVLGLALTGLGLSVTTLESINLVSQTITWLVYVGLALGIISLSRLVAARPNPGSTTRIA